MEERLHNESYGEALRLVRVSSGVDQYVLAERMGKTQKWLCERERGDRKLRYPDYLRGKAALLELVRERDEAFDEAMGASPA